jgi:hypothetical protein
MEMKNTAKIKVANSDVPGAGDSALDHKQVRKQAPFQTKKREIEPDPQ